LKSYLGNYRNSRDVEIPLLLEFVRSKPDIKSGLDVGCADSLYIWDLRAFLSLYDGVDLRADDRVAKALDNYFTGDVCYLHLDPHDLVLAISAVEHYRVKQKPVAFPLFSQCRMVKKMARLARKYLFFSVPYGEPVFVPGEFMGYSKNRLGQLLFGIKDFDLKKRFFFCPNPPAGDAWSEIGQSEADKVGYSPELGVQCVCIVEGVRRGV
jgi:hypothetical protein